MNKIEDLAKMDKVFYRKMVNHKKNRLWVRFQALNQANKTEYWKIPMKNEGWEDKEREDDGEKDESVGELSFEEKGLDIWEHVANRGIRESNLEG
jgi:hypothetical protein